MKIETLQLSDVKHLLDVIPEGWGDVLPIISWYTQKSFCHPFKFIIDEKIVGVGVAVFHKETAWLSHIMVQPEYRNQGLGSKITKHLVDFIHSKNIDSIYLIATEMGAPVYLKQGFVIESEYSVFKPSKSNQHVGVFDFLTNGNIKNIEEKHLVQIRKMDLQVSGEDRSAYLEEHLMNGHVYIKDELIEGFYLPTLGDGLVVATSKLAGQALLHLSLPNKEFVVFPEENTFAPEIALAHNFIEMYKIKRMFLGRKIVWQPENLYHRVGGNIG